MEYYVFFQIRKLSNCSIDTFKYYKYCWRSKTNCLYNL